MLATALLHDMGASTLPPFHDEPKFDPRVLLPSSPNDNSSFSFPNRSETTHLPFMTRRMSSSSSSSFGSDLSMPLPALGVVTDQLPSSPRHTSKLPHARQASSPISDAETVDKIPTKKPRAPPRERVSVKDFVPPDVSGLNKREARLIKNRAAAFLSRQRKREEFEAMEVRVGELEEENLRLRGRVTSTGRAAFDVERSYQVEVDRLRIQLQESERRAAAMREQLAQTQQVHHRGNGLREDSLALQQQQNADTPATKLGMMVLMSLSSVLQERLTNGWGDPVRITLSADMLGHGARPHDNSTNVAFELSFAPSLLPGRTQVTMTQASHMPEALWPASAPGMGPVLPGVAFDLPLALPEFNAFGDAWSQQDMKKRMHISVSRSATPGLWDVDIM